MPIVYIVIETFLLENERNIIGWVREKRHSFNNSFGVLIMYTVTHHVNLVLLVILWYFFILATNLYSLSVRLIARKCLNLNIVILFLYSFSVFPWKEFLVPIELASGDMK